MNFRPISLVLIAAITVLLVGCTAPTPEWETANPLEPLPEPPLGVSHTWDELKDPPEARDGAPGENGSITIRGCQPTTRLLA